jgi:hypothetical protein
LRWSFSFCWRKTEHCGPTRWHLPDAKINKVHSDLLTVALMLLAGCEIRLTLSASTARHGATTLWGRLFGRTRENMLPEQTSAVRASSPT